jgi:hypothetical protein
MLINRAYLKDFWALLSWFVLDSAWQMSGLLSGYE